MKPSLSAILIATDEERDLPGCLESLKGLCDEVVIVVDPATRDRTEAIAREYGAQVASRKFTDYASQRQASLELATGQWCLWVDPDERVSPELRADIALRLAAPAAEAYDIPFSVHFLGRRLNWGGMGSETHVRLF
ncbi:MAG: glycosyltransferase family 2 protein, partial [Elusimicrobiota bacterium]